MRGIHKTARLKASDRYRWQILTCVWTTFCVIFSLIPLYITIINSFKTNDEIIASIFSFPKFSSFVAVGKNYSKAFADIWAPLLRSIFTAGASTSINAVIGLILAYIFTQIDFHFKDGIYMLFIFIMLIPSIMGMPVLLPFVTNGLHLKDTYFGYLLPMIGGGQVGSLFLFRTFFHQLPQSVFESAKIDGASDSQIIVSIVTPLMFPIMLYYFVGTFASAYNDYLWPSLIFNDKMTLMPMILARTDYFNSMNEQGVVYAIYIIASIPLIVNAAISMDRFQSGEFASGMKL